MNWLTQHLETLIVLIVSPTLTWFFITKPYQKKELKQKDLDIDSSSSEIVSKNLEIYQRMLDDIDDRYKAQIKSRDLELQLLTRENAELKIEVSNLSNKVEELMSLVKTLEKKVKNI